MQGLPGTVACTQDGLAKTPRPGHIGAMHDADAAGPGQSGPSLWLRVLREPLVHFLCVGLLLFLVAGRKEAPPQAADAVRRIAITDDDLRQLRGLWQAQWNRPPTSRELRRLVEDQIREEIYFREALAAGLDRQDILVRRRLVERMAFLTATENDFEAPTETQLRDWYAAHAARFAVPREVRFQLLFFSDRARGGRAKEEAILARDALDGQSATAGETANPGDPAPFENRYEALSPDAAAGFLGQPLATALGRLSEGAWQGPVEVPGGWCLVFIEGRLPGQPPDYDAVKADVLEAWREDRRETARTTAFAAMRRRYQVELPPALVQENAP